MCRCRSLITAVAAAALNESISHLLGKSSNGAATLKFLTSTKPSALTMSLFTNEYTEQLNKRARVLCLHFEFVYF